MRRLRKYIKDIVYGANDGVITTFAIIAGVAGAHLSNSTILIVGIASLFADGFSMASSNYLGTKSECATREDTHQECEQHRQIKSAAWTFVSFVVAGSIPLLPYVLFPAASSVFLYSVAATGVALFLVGAFRSYVTDESFFRAGFEMLFVGGLAAAIAYFVGSFIQGVVS